jgi:hypothetical protein
MSIRYFSSCAVLVLALITGCASHREFERVEALRRDAVWPDIRAAAEKEIARREGSTQWSSSAYYAPQQHTNGVWAVVISGAYPNNRLGDSIDLLIRDTGEVISYSPRISWHPK